MSVQYFAKVASAQDHLGFQQLVRHYPSCSYEEWLFRERKKMTDWKSKRHEIKMVPITPEQFKVYCEKLNKPADLTTFLKALTDLAY